MQRWRVPLGFLCGALFLWFARPSWLTLSAGGGVALLCMVCRAYQKKLCAGDLRPIQLYA
jgi:hypothetical protein